MISLNGRPAEVPIPGTIEGILRELGLAHDARGVAVAVDGEVIPRAQWGGCAIVDGARIEVLTAMQGG